MPGPVAYVQLRVDAGRRLMWGGRRVGMLVPVLLPIHEWAHVHVEAARR